MIVVIILMWKFHCTREPRCYFPRRAWHCGNAASGFPPVTVAPVSCENTSSPCTSLTKIKSPQSDIPDKFI